MMRKCLSLTIFGAATAFTLLGCGRDKIHVDPPLVSPPGETIPDVVSTPGDAETIRLGSWNIEWLGNPGARSDHAKGVSQRAVDIADLIAWSAVDILSLQEITDDVPGETVRNTTLDEAFQILNDSGRGDWEYVMFAMPREGDQHLAMAWNKQKVSLGGTPMRVPVPDRDKFEGRTLWHRHPWAVPFSAGPGKSDFLLMPVHMKADYQGSFERHRAEEIRLLLEALPSAVTDPDFVIIGDTNMHSTNEPGIQALNAAGWRDLNSADMITFWSGANMDRILVPKDQPEFAQSTMTVASDSYLTAKGITADEFKERWSDHYLVWADMRVLPDDD